MGATKAQLVIVHCDLARPRALANLQQETQSVGWLYFVLLYQTIPWLFIAIIGRLCTPCHSLSHSLSRLYVLSQVNFFAAYHSVTRGTGDRVLSAYLTVR